MVIIVSTGSKHSRRSTIKPMCVQFPPKTAHSSAIRHRNQRTPSKYYSHSRAITFHAPRGPISGGPFFKCVGFACGKRLLAIGCNTFGGALWFLRRITEKRVGRNFSFWYLIGKWAHLSIILGFLEFLEDIGGVMTVKRQYQKSL